MPLFFQSLCKINCGIRVRNRLKRAKLIADCQKSFYSSETVGDKRDLKVFLKELSFAEVDIAVCGIEYNV